MRIVTLGTSSPYPRPGDPCSSFLVESGPTRLWLDAGSGTLAALLEHVALEEIDALWLSHTHADHFSDVSVLFYALRYGGVDREPLPVFGPPGWAARLTAFVSHGGSGALADVFDVHEVTDGWSTRAKTLSLSARAVHHGAVAHALRIEERPNGAVVVFSGDTATCPSLVEIAAGADLLISEAGDGVDELGTEDRVHMTAGEAGAVARDAGTGALLLTHLADAPPKACVEAACRAGATNVAAAVAGTVREVVRRTS